MPLNKSKKLDVMAAGDLFVDVILSGFPFWPQRGEEVVARDYCREIGGGAAIAACGLARLGSRVGVLGVVGSDVGKWMVERLQSAGIDTSGMHYDLDEPTALTVAISDHHDRSFFTYIGANRLFPGTLRNAADERLLAHARHVHLACAPDLDSAPALIAALRANDCTISLDVGWHEPWLRDPRALDIVTAVDLFFPNEREAAAMTEGAVAENDPDATLRFFARAGARGVALKLGAQGAALLWEGELLYQEGHAVDPVDTVGAGDCFDAGFLHAWLKGLPPATCLHAGAICGALSTEEMGGIRGFPSPERLEAALRGIACTK